MHAAIGQLHQRGYGYDHISMLLGLTRSAVKNTVLRKIKPKRIGNDFAAPPSPLAETPIWGSGNGER